MTAPSASLADWVLTQLKTALPKEPVFDAERQGNPLRYVILYCPRPSHEVVTLKPHKDRVDVTFIVHSFGTTRPECEWRSSRVQDALKNQKPNVTGYEFGLIEHPISRLDGPDYSAPDRLQLFAVDQFRVGGFEE